MEHIDRERLYTDAVYRFTYVSKFVDFGQDDIDAIHKVGPLLLPLAQTVVDAVYAKLHSFDITWEFMSRKHEGFEGKVNTDTAHLTETSEQIKFRKSMLTQYLKRILTQPYDARMITYLDYVARIHTDTPTKKSKINVDYIHINALMTYVESILIGGIRSLELEKEEEAKALLAFNKLMWLQNDFFAKYYVTKDGSEFKHLEGHVQKDAVGTSAGVCPMSGATVPKSTSGNTYPVDSPGLWQSAAVGVAAGVVTYFLMVARH